MSLVEQLVLIVADDDQRIQPRRRDLRLHPRDVGMRRRVASRGDSRWMWWAGRNGAKGGARVGAARSGCVARLPPALSWRPPGTSVARLPRRHRSDCADTVLVKPAPKAR